MFAVVVTFQIHEGSIEAFLPLMKTNAKTSLDTEPGCHRFDVCTDPSRQNEVFLYELYSDAGAFDAHLSSAHFKAFSNEAESMIASKKVQTYAQVAS